MKLFAKATRRSARDAPAAKHTDVAFDRPARAALAELAAATDGYVGDQVSPRRGRSRGLSLVTAALTALAVGAAFAFVPHAGYRCTAIMRFTPGTSGISAEIYRRELLDFAWRYSSEKTKGEGAADLSWSVDVPRDGALALHVVAPSPTRALATATSMAEGFCQAQARQAIDERETPGETERELSALADELETKLDAARPEMDAAIAMIPKTAPSQHRTALLARWQKLQSEVATARTEVLRQSAGVGRLRSEPQPTHGVVTSEERGKAIALDAALQQDLQELAVNLTELKAHLLTVWHGCDDALSQLAVTADDLVETVSQTNKHPDAATQTPQSAGLISGALDLRGTIQAFAVGFTAEFTTLQRVEVDPLDAAILAALQRIRRMLGDMLYKAGQELATLRATVQDFGRDASDNARRHVFLSNVLRAFHRVQSGYHRFEFSAGLLETPDNFRLDAALRAARGLRRRSQEQVRAIEARLQIVAVERAGRLHHRRLGSAQERLKALRAATSGAVDDLIALQNELNLSAEQSEAFLRTTIHTETAAARAGALQSDLDQVQGRLRTLAAKREQAARQRGVELSSATLTGSAATLAQRLRLGGLGAGVTLLTVLMAQWWTGRRP